MPVNLSIKNFPDEVVEGLRYRAARNQRSLNQEILAILRQAAKDQTPVTMDELLSNADRKRAGLDETVSKLRARQDAEQEKVARRFEELFGGSEDD